VYNVLQQQQRKETTMNIEKLDSLMDSLMSTRSGYELGTCQIAVLENDEIRSVLFAEDVYDGLDDFARPENAQAIIVETTGKATPLDGGDPRRVRLTVAFDGQTMLSGLEFGDTQERLFDEGEATGSLKEAIVQAWFA